MYLLNLNLQLNLQFSGRQLCVYWKLHHATINKTWNCQFVECSKSGNIGMYILFICFFVSSSLFFVFFVCFFELYEYNQWRISGDSCFYYKDNSKMNLWYCCFMQNMFYAKPCFKVKVCARC